MAKVEKKLRVHYIIRYEMIIFSYFFSSHSSMVPVSEENITHIRFQCRPNSLMQSLIKIRVLLIIWIIQQKYVTFQINSFYSQISTLINQEKIGVTRSCYTRYTFVSQKSHVRVTIVTRSCNGN